MLTRAAVAGGSGGRTAGLLRQAAAQGAASRRRPLHQLAAATPAAAAAGAVGAAPSRRGARGRVVDPAVSSPAAAAAAAAVTWKQAAALGHASRSSTSISSSSRRSFSSQAAAAPSNHHGAAAAAAEAVEVEVDVPGQEEEQGVLIPQPPQPHSSGYQPLPQPQPQQDGAAAPREGPEQRVSVMAFYVGQKLDLISVVQHNFLSHRGYKISDDVLLVPLARGDRDPSVIRSALVVFKHGSVVFFNVDDALQSRYLHALARHCGEVVPQAHRFRETLECRLRPWQEKYHEMGQDVVNLRELKEDSIKVVSDVIGHSVALNFYNQKADRMLEDFRVLNNAVEGSGVFTEMDKKDLFKLVALNNKILTDAMSSGLLEQSKPAWNFNRLDALWNDLRHEFSIGDRFAKVEHKINHVQSNTKFFLEILNHQKSNKLEWIIIGLISAEIVLSCADLYHQLLG